MCARESIGTSSMLMLIHWAVTWVRMFRREVGAKLSVISGSGTGPGCVVHDQLLKQYKSGVGFPTSLKKTKCESLVLEINVSPWTVID